MTTTYSTAKHRKENNENINQRTGGGIQGIGSRDPPFFFLYDQNYQTIFFLKHVSGEEEDFQSVKTSLKLSIRDSCKA